MKIGDTYIMIYEYLQLGRRFGAGMSGPGGGRIGFIPISGADYLISFDELYWVLGWRFGLSGDMDGDDGVEAWYDKWRIDNMMSDE